MFSCEKNLLPPYLAASESDQHPGNGPGNCSPFQVEKSKEARGAKAQLMCGSATSGVNRTLTRASRAYRSSFSREKTGTESEGSS